MRQHHFSTNQDGSIHAWDVPRLIAISKDLPVKLIAIPEDQLDEVYWFDEGDNRPTVRRVLDQIQRIEACDLSFPIILGSDGRVMDGMHRIAKAVLEGCSTIDAVQFDRDPEPDYTNCEPGKIPIDGQGAQPNSCGAEGKASAAPELPPEGQYSRPRRDEWS